MKVKYPLSVILLKKKKNLMRLLFPKEIKNLFSQEIFQLV